MQDKSDQGEALEKDWNSTLMYYQKKYPQEAEEFKTLLNGDLPRAWENSLPVPTSHTLISISLMLYIHFAQILMSVMDSEMDYQRRGRCHSWVLREMPE